MRVAIGNAWNLRRTKHSGFYITTDEVFGSLDPTGFLQD